LLLNLTFKGTVQDFIGSDFRQKLKKILQNFYSFTKWKYFFH